MKPRLLKNLPQNYKGPLSSFFSAYIRQTGSYKMSINYFTHNATKAFLMKQFGLHLLQFNLIIADEKTNEKRMNFKATRKVNIK